MAPQHLAIPDLVYDPAKSISGFNYEFCLAIVTKLEELIREKGMTIPEPISATDLGRALIKHLVGQTYMDFYGVTNGELRDFLFEVRLLLKTFEISKKEAELRAVLVKPLTVFESDLSTRAFGILKYSDMRSILDLVQKTKAEMFRYKNCGRISFEEMEEFLASMGLSFNMKFEDGVLYWPDGREQKI